MPTRKASAVWNGGIKSGSGTFKGESGAIQAPYSFATRFGDTPGTNPEELIAAAHAACYSMALSGGLEGNGTPATKIETTAACTVEKAGEGFAITKMKLTVQASVPGLAADVFAKIAAATKEGCPVSKALKGNVAIELDAKLA